MTPDVACRDAHADELPTTAARLLKAALAAGWTARATYARAMVLEVGGRAFAADDTVTRRDVVGRVVDVHRDKAHLGVLVDGRVQTWEVAETSLVVDVAQTGKVVESVAVRLRRWPLAAVGVWHNGAFALAHVWSAVSGPRKVGARDLARMVKAAA